MEIPRSLSKRSFSSGSNGGGGFIPPYNVVAYDGVFGTLPDSRSPMMTPRFEEYSEIFGGFNASRSSSIPVLHIPHAARGSRLRFDVRNPDFDYAEVFGRAGGVSAVTTSFQDVLGRSSGGCSCFSDESR
ncbi:hypothetical protein M569_06202 [Genlisea aurea]|uniref:Uncharacterized protein n=1 Tax=Genlisea aurea TaxID=192259 RepID=S8CN11_9LAMI|nr:hypothetical protein M569_06202 [Genlisea aurea]